MNSIFIKNTPKCWWVYIVECNDGTYYTGIALDIRARMAKHESGKGSKYIRSRLPIRLLWQSECGTRALASKEEYRIKQLSKKDKRKLIDAGL